MKKYIYSVMIFMVTCLTCFSLTSCKKQEDAGKKKKIRLEFYNRKREAYAVLEKIIEKFNESQDEIEVFQNMNTNADTALRIAAVEGDFPDIVELGGLQSVETFEYVMGNCLVPLDEMECTKQIKEEYLPYLRCNSHIYQMPLAMSFEGIYVNRTLFQEEGLALPETYEELCQVSEEILRRGKVPFLFADKEGWTIHQNWECIEGATRGNFEEFWTDVAEGRTSFTEDEVCRRSLEKLIELHQYSTEEYSNLNYNEALAKFAEGEGFMLIQGSWAYRNLMNMNPEMNLELIPFPVEEGTQQLVTMWIDSSIGISSDCKYRKEAEKFVEFLMQPENLQTYLNKESSLSSLKNSQNRAKYAPRIHELLEHGHAVMDASWLPLQTSVIRDIDIQELMPDADSAQVEAYLDKYTRSLQKHKDLYLEAKEKRQ